jgi:predicted ATP-dependent serine protease
MSTGHWTPSPAEAKKAVEKMRRKTRKLVASPETARAFLIKYGFITKKGELAPRYR